MHEDKTSNTKKKENLASNAKILVNFEKKLVLHTYHHEGSNEYRGLIAKGYVMVGTAKGNVRFFWESNHFQFNDKYTDNQTDNQTDTITT